MDGHTRGSASRITRGVRTDRPGSIPPRPCESCENGGCKERTKAPSQGQARHAGRREVATPFQSQAAGARRTKAATPARHRVAIAGAATHATILFEHDHSILPAAPSTEPDHHGQSPDQRQVHHDVEGEGVYQQPDIVQHSDDDPQQRRQQSTHQHGRKITRQIGPDVGRRDGQRQHDENGLQGQIDADGDRRPQEGFEDLIPGRRLLPRGQE